MGVSLLFFSLAPDVLLFLLSKDSKKRKKKKKQENSESSNNGCLLRHFSFFTGFDFVRYDDILISEIRFFLIFL